LSHERKDFAEAETLGTVEGNMCDINMRDAVAPPGSKVPSRPKRSASEPERSHVRPLAAEQTGPHREGEEPKPMMHGHEKSDSAIVATKPPNKVAPSMGVPSAIARGAIDLSFSSVIYVPENVRFCRTNIRSRPRWRLLSSRTRTPNGRLATRGGRDSLSAALTSRE
jgi:hypothetical protein